jgi:hypothetical protein
MIEKFEAIWTCSGRMRIMKARKRMVENVSLWCLLLIGAIACAASRVEGQESSPTLAQTMKPSAATPEANTTGTSSFAFDVPASQQWLDTKITLHARAKVHITAEGNVTYPKGKTFGPEGLSRTIKDVIHEYAVTNAAHGALVAQLGTGAGAHAFLVGESLEYEAPVAGRLYVGINQSMKAANEAVGGFRVRVEVLNPGLSDAAAALIVGPAESKIPGLTPELLAKIPRRISDQKGDPGDMVNAFLIGSEQEVVQAFSAGGWVKVDRGVEKTWGSRTRSKKKTI